MTQPDAGDLTDKKKQRILWDEEADLVHEKRTDGDSHVTTPVALLVCLNHRNHKTCVPSVDALCGHETSPSGGPRSYW